jgi:hypothetical protein
MRRNADIDAGLGALADVGIRDIIVSRGSKHWQLRWNHNGQPRMVSVAVNSGDWRSPHNVRAEVRRPLRLDGLLPEPTPSKAFNNNNWREQVESLSRQLRRVHVPSEKAGERDAIAIALRRLVNQGGPTVAANGKEAIAQML